MSEEEPKAPHYELSYKIIPIGALVGTALVMGILYIWLQLMKAL